MVYTNGMVSGQVLVHLEISCMEKGVERGWRGSVEGVDVY